MLNDNQTWDVAVHAGHVYVTGNDQANTRGNIDLFARQYDLDGNLLWAQLWDNGEKDAGFVIVPDAAGKALSLYIGGYTRVGNVNQALLQKRNALDGKLLWTKAWGAIPHGHHEIDGIAIVGDDLYVSHYDSTFAAVNVNAVVKKFSKEELDRTEGRAEPLWSKVWGDPATEQDTTDGHIHADPSGVWITGRIRGQTLLGPRAGGDVHLTKIDPRGNLLWTKTWGAGGYDQGLNLVSDGKGMWVAGWTNSRGAGGFDALVLRFGMDGALAAEILWGGRGLDLSRGVTLDGTHVYAACSRSFASCAQTFLLKLEKETLKLVDSAVWEGQGEDQACDSACVDGSFVYLVGKSTRFTGETRRFQPVLLKVSKDFGAPAGVRR